MSTMRAVWGIITLLFVLGITTPVWADLFMVQPTLEKAKPDAIIRAGKMLPGERMELIINTDSGYGSEATWQQAVLQSNHRGIRVENSGVGTDSLIAYIETLPATPLGTYQIMLTMVGEPGVLEEETYIVQFQLEPNLVNASLTNAAVEGRVNEPLEFRVLLVNDSSAPARLKVEPALPLSWSAPQEVVIAPHSFETTTLEVTPRFAGEKKFDIRIYHETTQTTVDRLTGALNSTPTVQDRYAAGFFGFPFFTISLVSGYLTNALFSLML